MATLALAATSSWTLFAIFAGPSVLASIFYLSRDILSFKINIFQLTFFVTIIWYFGPVVAGSLPGSPISLPLDAMQTAVSAGAILISLMLVLVVSMFFRRPVLDVDWDGVSNDRLAVEPFVYAVALLQIVLIGSGQWTFGSLSSHMNGDGKGLLMFTSLLSSVSGPLCAVLLAHYLRQRRVVRPELLLMIICAGVALLWALIAGRRIFATAVVIEAAAFFAVFWRGQPFKSKVVQGAVAGIIGIIVISIGWQTFYMFRLTSYALQRGAEIPTISELYSMSKSIDGRVAEIRYNSNLSTRSGIIGSVNVFTQSAQGFLGGESALGAVVATIPSALFPGKDAWERSGASNPEFLWSSKLGVPHNDWANTLFLDGYADFSVFGLPIYLVFANLLVMLARFATFANRTSQALIAIPVLVQVLSVENGLASFISTIRNALLLILIWTVFAHLIGRLVRRAAGTRSVNFTRRAA